MHPQTKIVHPSSHLPFNPHQKLFGGTTNSKAIQIPNLKKSNKSSSDEDNKPGPRLARSFGDYGSVSKRDFHKIYCRGYLMKRSNEPVVDVYDYDDETVTDEKTAISTSPAAFDALEASFRTDRAAAVNRVNHYIDSEGNRSTSVSETEETSSRNELYFSEDDDDEDDDEEESSHSETSLLPSLPRHLTSNSDYGWVTSSERDPLIGKVTVSEQPQLDIDPHIEEAVFSAAAFFGINDFDLQPDIQVQEKEICSYQSALRSGEEDIVKKSTLLDEQSFSIDEKLEQDLDGSISIPILDNIPRKVTSSASDYSISSTQQRALRSDSLPDTFVRNAALVTSSPQCECIDPRDGHVWRSKYCVLEEGVLYFYRNEKDADFPEAQEERSQRALHSPSHQQFSMLASRSSCQPWGQERESLSKSPLPRGRILESMWSEASQRVTPSFDADNSQVFEDDNPTIWEKKVVLETVGAVRTTEEEYGENSFVLMAADEDCLLGGADCLVLRASSTDEMNMWLFQFHSALASAVRKMITSVCASHNNGGAGRKMNGGGSHTLYRHPRVGALNPTFSPFAYAHQRRVDAETLSLPKTRSISPSLVPLSHGHGRNGMNRMRKRGVRQRKLSSSSVESSPRPKAWDEISDRESTPNYVDVDQESLASSGYRSLSASPARPMLRISPSMESPVFRSFTSSPFPAIPNLLKTKEETSTSIPAPGKYIPPHLRRKLEADAQSAGGTPEIQKYVPPYLRKTQLTGTGENIDLGGTSFVDDNGSCAGAVDEYPPFNCDAAIIGLQPLTPSMSRISFGAASEGSPVDLRAEIKLGGCADPLFGSILDTANIKGPKVGQVEAVAFGGYGGGSRLPPAVSTPSATTVRWEVGALSECGIRESNEDAFIVAEDLLAVCGVDEALDAGTAKVGLFAIFDGHCGSQASRFAAEQFAVHLVEAFGRMSVDSTGRGDKDASPSLDELRQAVLNAMATLDHEFCHISKEDGRNWESGSTALVVLVSGDHVLVANLGDCRAVICASGVKRAQLDKFSEDDGWNLLEYDQQFSWSSYFNQKPCFWKEVCDIHSPSREDERRRIEAANGWVTLEKEVCVAQLRRVDLCDEDVVEIMRRYFSDRIDVDDEEWAGGSNVRGRQERHRAAPGRLLEISRICGELAVSRAIGDRDFKASFNQSANINGEGHWWAGPKFLPYPLDHNFSFRGDLVSAVPEIQIQTVGNEGVDDEFLLLACDGLWDVMDPDDAVRITRSLLFEKKWTAKKAAARLAEIAGHLGSSDNITVIIIRFFNSNTNI